MSGRVPWELAALVIVAVVGAVDAAVGGSPDLVVVLVGVAVLGSVSFIRSATRRRTVTLRADLAAWLARRAADRGTTIDDEAAHAIAAFRAAVTPDPPAPSEAARG